MDCAEQWRPAPKDLSLPDAVVHVWRAESHPCSTDFLSAGERERAAQFHFDKDRNRYVAARSVLRQLIGRYEQVSPEGIQFTYNTYGKPALENSTLRFNLSHSADVVLLAFTRNKNIGVDVERIRPEFAAKEIAGRFFSQEEVALLRALPVESLPESFFTCWTRKEAFIKGHGSGLSLPLHRFVVSLDSPARLVRTDFDPDAARQWTLHDLRIDAGFRAALAVEGEPIRIDCWQWV
jgi:4'-phosphopantetheinyl transferase